MFTARRFKELVSGEAKGAFATVLRLALRVAEVPYTWIVCLRNRRYDRGQAECHSAAIPVVSVGNLTLGGTGKTPMVQYLGNWFRERGVRVAIVSRGYGAADDGQNDEARELGEKLPDVPHLQNPDRVAAAHVAVDELQMQLILLDDGFQHRRLARNLDIVLIDALEPFGFGHVFPRGTLREPVSGLDRADVVALSRADLIDDSERGQIRRRAVELSPQALWIEMAHRPTSLLGRDATDPIELLEGKRVCAFCGIGNPAGFRRTLESCGVASLELREFPDHHRYSRDDINALEQWVQSCEADLVLCTHKDLVKVNLPRLGDRPLRAVIVSVRVLVGEEELQQRLSGLLPHDGQGEASSAGMPGEDL